MADDAELLREYVEQGGEEAFRELFERHGGLVYATAHRVLRDDSLAQEATQATFILLARKAAHLSPNTVLAGWLYRTARFVALESRRSEHRRRQNEDRLIELESPPELAWTKIEPLVDEAMDSLGATDRNAVILRFFEGRSFAEVAHALGTTEAAAKMRVGRALDKLRGSLATQGVTVSTALLGSAITAQGGATLPVGMKLLASSASIGLGASHKTTTWTLVERIFNIMAWNKAKKLTVATILLLLVGGATVGTLGLLRFPHRSKGPIVATFEPMAGEWEGTFVMSGNGLLEPWEQKATLSVRTTDDGSTCDIEMRVLTPAGNVDRVYHFSHSITAKGRAIVTEDDPTVRRIDGEGVVTASSHNPQAGQWRAAFLAQLPSQRGTTECEWERKADQLTIVRHDRDAQGGEGTSELRLRKIAKAQSQM